MNIENYPFFMSLKVFVHLTHIKSITLLFFGFFEIFFSALAKKNLVYVYASVKKQAVGLFFCHGYSNETLFSTKDNVFMSMT